MDLNYDLIGIRIRQYREAKGFSQEELAERINATERHIRNIETGKKGPSVSLLVSLANALDVTANDLLADHLTGSNKTFNDEVIDLLTNCTPTEKAILMDMLRHMKKLLSEHGI